VGTPSTTEAWEHFLGDDLWPRLVASATRRGLRHHEADDVAQEAIMRWLQAVKKGTFTSDPTDPVAVSQYVFTVLRHLIRAHHRRQTRQQEVLLAPDSGAWVSLTTLRLDPVRRLVIQERLKRLLPGLTLRQRQILLRYLDGETYEEIAVALGVTKGTISKVMNIIRTKAREAARPEVGA
jgi:RNA polymerase sigma factor (sigma-70 family)